MWASTEKLATIVWQPTLHYSCTALYLSPPSFGPINNSCHQQTKGHKCPCWKKYWLSSFFFWWLNSDAIHFSDKRPLAVSHISQGIYVVPSSWLLVQIHKDLSLTRKQSFWVDVPTGWMSRHWETKLDRNLSLIPNWVIPQIHLIHP